MSRILILFSAFSLLICKKITMQKCSQCSVRKQIVKQNEFSFNVLINSGLIRFCLYLFVNRTLSMV